MARTAISMKTLFHNATKGVPIFQYLAAFTSFLNIMCSGMCYGWTSPTLPQLLRSDSPIHITDDEGSWIAVLLLIGEMCGGVLAGLTVDRIGRKKLILITSVPFFISWMMIAYAQSVEMLLVARFLAGISDGLVFPTDCIYLAEIAEPKIRGFLGSSITVVLIFGMLFVNILGSYLSITTTALIASVVPVLLLLTFSWMPESPYYLIMKGNLDEARRNLKILRGTDDVEAELKRLTEAIEEQNSNTGRYFDLFTVSSNRKAIFVIMGVRATQLCTGGMAFVFYLQMIFTEAGNDISPSVASMIYFTVQVVIGAFATGIVDRIGRRPLLIISVIGVTLALLVQGSYFVIKNKTDINTDSFALVPIIALIAFVIVYNIGLQTIPLLLVGELFPTNVKAFAASYCDFYFAIVTTIVSKFFQFTKDEFGLHVPFFAFAACAMLGFVFIIFLVPETKGKTLEEIQAELKGKNPNRNSVREEKYIQSIII